jgi:5-deoxy-glucuronate isomerase
MQLRFQASGRAGYEVIIKNLDTLAHILEFGILRLGGDDDTYSNHTGSCEAMLHIIEGSCTVTAAGDRFENIGDRRRPFEGRPTALFLPPETAYTIESTHVEIAITLAASSDGGAPTIIAADDAAPASVGAGNWQRTVTMIAPPDFPSRKLILGETVNPPGNWSGVPAHKHDTLEPGIESVHEELYYFRVDHPGGWGVQRVYDKQGLDEMPLIQDRTVIIMPRGYHTVSAAPGFTLYYAFVLAGPNKQLHPNMDPDQSWIAS